MSKQTVLITDDTQDIAMMTSHSQDEPYCNDRDCWCHFSVEHHAEVTGIPQHSEEEVRSAFRAFGVVQ